MVTHICRFCCACKSNTVIVFSLCDRNSNGVFWAPTYILFCCKICVEEYIICIPEEVEFLVPRANMMHWNVEVFVCPVMSSDNTPGPSKSRSPCQLFLICPNWITYIFLTWIWKEYKHFLSFCTRKPCYLKFPEWLVEKLMTLCLLQTENDPSASIVWNNMCSFFTTTEVEAGYTLKDECSPQ